MASRTRPDLATIAGVVHRPRLYEILDSPLVRVCVVQGPSGSGKTTLVRSWALQGEPRALVWVSLNGDITSRSMLWQLVVASAERHGDLSKQAAARIREELSLTADPVRIASALLADAGQVVLVFDAYEHLGEVMPQIDEDLSRLAEAVPELRVIVTTRSTTALGDLMLPEGVARVITLGELALTPDEVGELIAAQTGARDERVARTVVSATRGFPLTVRAVLLALAQLGRVPNLDSIEWDAVAASRLEVLLPDAAAVRFVTDTSVPPYVDAELAERLSGAPDTTALLGMLERNGFGRWIPYARGRPVFQYVETIRDTFRARAADDAERFRRSCLVTAGWLLQNEEVVDQALQFAIDGGDYALADRVFVAVVISNPDSYITDRFLPTLRRVPEHVLPEYPMLAFGLGLALMASPVLRGEAPRVFRIAVGSTAYPAYVDPVVDAFSHAAMRAISRRLALSFRASGEASLDVLRMVDEIPADVLARYAEHVGTILRQLSFSLWQGGHIPEAIDAISRSVSLCERPAPRNYSMVFVAGLQACIGDTRRAELLLGSIDPDGWSLDLRETSLNGLGLYAEAWARLDALDFAGALTALRGTHGYMGTNAFWPMITHLGLRARHGLGQASAEADRVMRELRGAVPPPGLGDGIATEQLIAALAQAWMAAGDHRTAGALLDEQPSDSPFLVAARIAWLLGTGRDREALDRARAGLELPGHTIRSRAEAQTLAAVAALREHEPEAAQAWLDGAAVAWENYGARMHVALLNSHDRRTLAELARESDLPALAYLDVPLIPGTPTRVIAAPLTPRESAVLAALAEHDSIRDVADALFVSPHTVKTQLQSIYRKLGVSSRGSALAVARETGLIGP